MFKMETKNYIEMYEKTLRKGINSLIMVNLFNKGYDKFIEKYQSVLSSLNNIEFNMGLEGIHTGELYVEEILNLKKSLLRMVVKRDLEAFSTGVD